MSQLVENPALADYLEALDTHTLQRCADHMQAVCEALASSRTDPALGFESGRAAAVDIILSAYRSAAIELCIRLHHERLDIDTLEAWLHKQEGDGR